MPSLPFDLRSIDRQAFFNIPDMADGVKRSRRSKPHKASHLVALVHGLWGNANHLKYVAEALHERYSDDELVVLACRSNPGSLTYDGIEVGGERVAKEIEDILEELKRDGYKITKLSLVGYSLGGLLARYAIGLLDHKGYFDEIEPVNFTTFVTPHLGVRTPLTGYQSHLWNVVGARLLSASGRQLFLIDDFRDTGRPILSVLADPDSIFVHALARFRHRSLYTNIVNDLSAVFYTTGISRIDPFTDLSKVQLNYVKGYDPVILDPDHACDALPQDALPSFYVRLRHKSRSALRRGPIYLALAVLLPVATLAFLASSVVQTFRSRRRILRHETDPGASGFGMYRIPYMVREMRVGLEDAFENVNSAQQQEYLPEGSEEWAAAAGPSSSLGASTTSGESCGSEKPLLPATKVESVAPERAADFPTLALTPVQFAMIKTLDDVGFRKYPVFIHKSSHSHAAIIVRSARAAFEEGKTVIRHWLENEFHV